MGKSLYGPIGFRHHHASYLSLMHIEDDIAKVRAISPGFQTSPIYRKMPPYICAKDVDIL
jgi:hypothetical protein